MKYILFLAALSLMACKCNNDSDPNPIDSNPTDTTTTEKQNYFRCVVNGEEWRPTAFCGSCLDATYYECGFTIGAIKIKEPYDDVFISYDFVCDTGKYLLNKNNYGAYAIGVQSPLQYYTNDTVGGFLRITKIDTLSRRISGEFEYNCINEDSNKVVEIRNGIFENVKNIKLILQRLPFNFF